MDDVLKLGKEQIYKELIGTLIRAARGYSFKSVTETCTPNGIVTSEKVVTMQPDKAAQDVLDANGIEWRV